MPATAAAVLMKHAAQLHSAGFVAPPDKGAGVGLPQFHHVHLLPGPGLEHELEPEAEPGPVLEPELNQWLGLEAACELEPGLGLDPTVAKVLQAVVTSVEPFGDQKL
ncbi:unnamed protein product [Sphagnum jensenii]